jgi:hypothetical protein
MLMIGSQDANASAGSINSVKAPDILIDRNRFTILVGRNFDRADSLRQRADGWGRNG